MLNQLHLIFNASVNMVLLRPNSSGAVSVTHVRLGSLGPYWLVLKGLCGAEDQAYNLEHTRYTPQPLSYPFTVNE